jgi:hypothetical protein
MKLFPAGPWSLTAGWCTRTTLREPPALTLTCTAETVVDEIPVIGDNCTLIDRKSAVELHDLLVIATTTASIPEVQVRRARHRLGR